MRPALEKRRFQQIPDRARRFPEAVHQLVEHVIVLLLAADGSDPLVEIQLLRLTGNIAVRNISVDIEVDGRIEFLLNRRFPLQALDGFVQQLAVKIVSHLRHMPALGLAQHIACASDLQIPHGNAETASQFRVLPDRAQTLLGRLLQHEVSPVHQESVSCTAGPADPAPELVKLGKAHPVRVVDDHRIYVRDIEAGLYNCRSDQDIDVRVDKIVHDVLDLLGVHLPVGVGDPGLRHQFLHLFRHIRDRGHMIVDKIDLSVPGQLSADRLPDGLLIVLHDKGLDRKPVLRRFLQDAHIPDPGEAHVERARDRRGRQRQNVHFLAQLLDLLLMGDAEALLLVHDQQAQVFKGDILRQEPVGSDHDINSAVPETLHGFRLLGPAPEAAHEVDPDREILHALQKRIVMLLGQDRSRNQDGNLPVLLDCLEGGPDRDLCLAVTDVSADQPVHDLPGLHVFLCIRDRRKLVLGLLIGEHFLKLRLPGRIRAVGKAFFPAPCRIQVDKLLGDLLDRRPDPGAGPGPVISAQLRDSGRLCLRIRVFLDHVQLGRQYIEVGAPGVFYLHVIFLHAARHHLFHAPVDADPVVFMDNIIARRQLREGSQGLPLIALLPPALLLFFLAEDIALGKNRETEQRIGVAAVGIAPGHHNLPVFKHPVRVLRIEGGDLILRQVLGQAFPSGPGGAEQDDSVMFPAVSGKVFQQKLKITVIDACTGHLQVKFPFHRPGHLRAALHGKPHQAALREAFFYL